jgi:hypothetical protein
VRVTAHVRPPELAGHCGGELRLTNTERPKIGNRAILTITDKAAGTAEITYDVGYGATHEQRQKVTTSETDVDIHDVDRSKGDVYVGVLAKSSVPSAWSLTITRTGVRLRIGPA